MFKDGFGGVVSVTYMHSHFSIHGVHAARCSLAIGIDGHGTSNEAWTVNHGNIRHVHELLRIACLVDHGRPKAIQVGRGHRG